MRIVWRSLTFVVLLGSAAAHAAEDAVWEKLRAGGQVVLMRHTQTTPGVGDPPGFRINDCATQRNLTEQGRDEARRIGEALRARGVRIGEVLSSRWCRAMDTAKLAFGRAEVWSELNNTFQFEARRNAQTAAVRMRTAGFFGPDNLFLVGHGANIQALTGIHPAPGGMVVVTPGGGGGGFTVVGEIDPQTLLGTR